MDELGDQVTPPAESPAETRGYSEWYSAAAIKSRDAARKRLETPAVQQGIGRRLLSWAKTHLGIKQIETGPKLTVLPGGGETPSVSSFRVIPGAKGLEKTAGDVARSSIEGRTNPPDNVLQHPNRYPGAAKPPPIDVA